MSVAVTQRFLPRIACATVGAAVGLVVGDPKARVTVSGSSMAPTLDGKSDTPNTLLLDRLSGWLGLYARGDVVAMRTPDEHHTFVVKRIIGIAGDTVVTRAGQSVVVPESHLWVGEPSLDAPLLPQSAHFVAYLGACCGTEGDNAQTSVDSNR